MEDHAVSPTVANQKNIVIAVSVVIVAGLFVYVLLKRPGDGTLTIKSGDTEMKMEFSGNKIDLGQFMDQLVEDKSRAATLAILREVYHLYEGNSPYLIDALRALPYDHPVIEKLRELSENHAEMFKPMGIPTYISLSNHIPIGEAMICAGSKYHRRKLLIINPTNNAMIEVLTSHSTPCLQSHMDNICRINDNSNDDKTQETQVKIQRVRINPKKSKELFGDTIPKGPTRACMVPVPEGYSVEPVIAEGSGVN
jgi:hypothetical protein